LDQAAFNDATADAGRTYFYAVTAVGPTGLESNRSRELVVQAAAGSAAAAGVSPVILRWPR
jgi:fibronectin type 3 domain-containing protein